MSHNTELQLRKKVWNSFHHSSCCWLHNQKDYDTFQDLSICRIVLRMDIVGVGKNGGLHGRGTPTTTQFQATLQQESQATSNRNGTIFLLTALLLITTLKNCEKKGTNCNLICLWSNRWSYNKVQWWQEWVPFAKARTMLRKVLLSLMNWESGLSQIAQWVEL